MANTVYSYSPTVPRLQWPLSVVSHSSVITVGEGVRGMVSRVCHAGGCEADTLPARKEMTSAIMNVTSSLGQLVEIQNGQSYT